MSERFFFLSLTLIYTHLFLTSRDIIYVAILRAGNGKGGGNIFKASSNGTAVSKLARKKGMKAITDFFDQWSSSAGHGEGQRIEQSSNSIEENNDDDL